jgi:hypothetical protein
MPTQRFMQTWILAWITRTKHMQCGDFGDFGPFFNTKKGLCTYHIGFFRFLFFPITRMQNSPKTETLMPISDFFGRKFSFFWDFLGKYTWK